MPSFFNRRIDFTVANKPGLNFTTLTIGSHTRNIRRAINRRVYDIRNNGAQKCDCIFPSNNKGST